MANRVVGAFGPNRLLRYSISGWDQLPFHVHETTYSTTSVLDFRMGPAPFLVHEKTYSTTAVLDFWMGPAPFSRPRDDLFDYYGTRFPDGTSSLSRP
jgi:hypothetical protein